MIATLALGIGANAAVFSMINSVLLLPLRFSEPARLFVVRAHSEKDGAPTSYSYLDFLDARRGSGSFEGMVAWRGQGANLSGIGEPEYVQTRQASAGLFSVLGMNLPLGREFSAEEDRPGADPVALISYDTWQRHFSGEPRVFGARVTLDGKPHVVVGVLPAGFDLFGSVPVYTPLGQHDDIQMRGRQFSPGIWAIGRLKPGVTVAEASAELGVLGRQLAGSTLPRTDTGTSRSFPYGTASWAMRTEPCFYWQEPSDYSF